MSRILRIAASAAAAAIALIFLREWLAQGAPFLIVMALIVAGCAAYAVWSGFDLLCLYRPAQPRPGQVGPLRGSMTAPALAPARAAAVNRIVAALAAEAVFAPQVPEARSLHGPIADRNDAPDHEGVLTALFEAEYYDGAFDPARHLANLAFHDSKAEQFEETIADQIADLARLAGPDLMVETVAIKHSLVAGPGPQPLCSIALLANGEPLHVQYRPAAKYLSTVLHVAIARKLRDISQQRRLACLWSDQGVWITSLRAGGVERLNAAREATSAGFGGWEWLDLIEPVAAGGA